METIVILAIAIVLVALLVVAIYRLWTRVSREKETALSYSDVIAGTVVADLVSYLLIRDSERHLYAVPREYAPYAKVHDLVHAQCFDNTKQDDQLLNAAKFREYVISDEKNAKRAQVIRRLNERYALCLLGKTPILVQCMVYEQIKAQKPVSMVQGTHYDGNDRMILDCKDVIELPVVETDGEAVFQTCYLV